MLREPLVVFAVAGAALFALYAVLRPDEPAGEDLPAAGAAVSRSVRLGTQELELQRNSFRAAWKREPTATELADLIETHVSEEILYREGLALGLDRDDAVVRRRLIEKATALARPAAPAADPDATELRRWYALYPHRFRLPAALSLEQLYFDARKRGDPRAAAVKALAQLAARAPGQPAPANLGDEFVLPSTLTDRSEAQIAHLFGPAFARAVTDAPLGRWHGPISSNYGLHLVRVTERREARMPSFEEAEKHVRADWLTAQNRGLRAAALGLLPRYQLQVDPGVRAAVAGAPAIAPFLERAK